jgi:RNA-directed DNA polymerase
VLQTQEEIVMAYQKENLKEVYRLQYKLLMSFEARALAVRKVTTNRGSKTPGVDKTL